MPVESNCKCLSDTIVSVYNILPVYCAICQEEHLKSSSPCNSLLKRHKENEQLLLEKLHSPSYLLYRNDLNERKAVPDIKLMTGLQDSPPKAIYLCLRKPPLF